MKILKNIRNSYWPTHYGTLRLVLVAASVGSLALTLGFAIVFPGFPFPGNHWPLGSHWN